jgi:hypothetical protein
LPFEKGRKAVTIEGQDEDVLRNALLEAGFSSERDVTADDPERVWNAARGELSPEETHVLAERAVAEPALALAWRLARELATAADDERQSAARVVPFARRWRWAALAAAAVVIVGLSVMLLRPEISSPGLRYRSAPELTIESLLNPAEARDREQLVLRWSPGPEGSLYDVVVTDADLHVLAQSERLANPSYAVPASALAKLEPGAELLWRVVLLTPRGERVVSPTFVEQLR